MRGHDVGNFEEWCDNHGRLSHTAEGIRCNLDAGRITIFPEADMTRVETEDHTSEVRDASMILNRDKFSAISRENDSLHGLEL
jgi:hypothetical protein